MSIEEYTEAWRRVIFDATGDNSKALRAIELANLNGLFDAVRSIGRCQTCNGVISRECTSCQRAWES